MKLSLIPERWRAFAGTDAGKRLVRVLRNVFLVAIVGVLIYQIWKIGWDRLLHALPSEPAFYVLLLAMYFLLPVTEAMIYGRIWSMPPWQCIAVMIRKRVLNMDVIGYSGEVYLFMWAKDRVQRARKAVMGVIKDNLIVSSISSLLSASLLIGECFFPVISPRRSRRNPRSVVCGPRRPGRCVYRCARIPF